jgi:hypothetical protein
MNRLFIATALLMLAVRLPVFAEESKDVMSQIERMASLKEKADTPLVESIADGIERNPEQVSRALILKLNDKNLTEQQQAVYVWALGLTRDQTAEGSIEALYKQNKSDNVRVNCLRALAAIGGKRAGDFLLSTLDATQDKGKRFDILNLLGQMQYEAALPKTEEVLRQDPNDFYWQSIFVFGKMGDKGIPFLLKQINHKDRNIRANAINVLGQWLIPPEAAKPLEDRFWMEKDTGLRGLILSSLERTIPDFMEMKVVFEQVALRESNEKLAGFARETLGNLDHMKADVASFKQKKQPSAASFQREYEQLFKSAGNKGSYETLGISSTAQDEPKLKALRERILQRDSDEAFYDYQKVNGIILRNRTIAAMTEQKPVQK